MPDSIKKLKAQWRKEWEEEQQQVATATAEETNAAILKKLRALEQRTWFKKYVPWMDDAEKRAACEILYGPQDWQAIREAAETAARDGRLPPEVEARLRGRAHPSAQPEC